MATHHHHLSIFIALTIISIVSAAGVTIDLIDRDSPDSPLYSNSTSDVDRLYDAFHRSILRARELARRAKRAAASPSSTVLAASIFPGLGDYLVDLSIGTPPRRFLAIVDTGSDLTWTQCLPCRRCFKQKLPIFDPRRSTSYRLLTCDSAACDTLQADQKGCKYPGKTCTYVVGYGDDSTSFGDLATETLTFEYAPDVLPRDVVTNVTFGCGHRNQGVFNVPDMGIFGLGQGKSSFPSQTKGNPHFEGKFAYCLIPKTGKGVREDLRSKLSFGSDAVVYGDNAVTSPMESGWADTFYYLTLKGVTVVGENTQIQSPFTSTSAKRNGTGPGKSVVEAGSMIIDSGTTLTFLPIKMFDQLWVDLKLQIPAATITDPRGILHLCFQGVIDAPYIVFHFTGADLRLPPQSTFVTVARDVICLAMLPVTWGIQHGVFGSLAQANFVVAHDLGTKTITFKPMDCKTYVP